MQLAGDPHALPRSGRLRDGAAPQPRLGERRLGIGVDRLEDALDPVAVEQLLGALGADVLDPPQVDRHRLEIGRRQRRRLRDLHLQAVATVVDPSADHVRALSLLEVDQRADQHDRISVVAGGFDHRPAALLAGVAPAPHGDLRVEIDQGD